MAYGVVIKADVFAKVADTYNRVAKSGESTTVDIENGSVVVLASKSAVAGEREVWLATCPATATLTAAVWMVASSENPVTVTASGKQWRNDNPDPRDFINLKDKTFGCFRLSVGDEIVLSADAVEGTKGANTYLVVADAKYKLQWASAAISGPSLKLIGADNISLPNGTIGDSQRQTAYRFVVEKLA
jgi:hypothetical protein